MGFYSTFTTMYTNVDWPQWFREKYEVSIHFSEGPCILIAKGAFKTYDTWEELPVDIQRAMPWDDFDDFDDSFFLVLLYLHECDGVTRCEINKNTIRWSEPNSWRETNGVTHDYCYGCSDVQPASAEGWEGDS